MTGDHSQCDGDGRCQEPTPVWLMPVWDGDGKAGVHTYGIKWATAANRSVYRARPAEHLWSCISGTF